MSEERIINSAKLEFVEPQIGDTKPVKKVLVEFEFNKDTPRYVLMFFGYMTCLLAKPLAKMASKNKGYGNSVARRGIFGVLIRIEDKANRVWNILTNGGTLSDTSFGVRDESAKDSIGDIKGYADIGYAMSQKVSPNMSAWDEVTRLSEHAESTGKLESMQLEY